MKRALLALATALLVVTAGCAATPGTGTPTAVDGATDGDGTSGDGATDGGADDTSSDRGTVNFYVSDQPNDMDDFVHLNVTITTVKFHLVDAADNGSAGDEENATTTAAATPDGTDADDGDATETDADEETEEREDGDDEREGDEMDDDGEGEDGRWVTREVNATSVDLSQLRGANATLLQQFDLPSDEYDKVHMEVGDINGTLTTGESANVKLPSERLKLNSEFTVENGAEVDFVYDVTVHEAGNSGKYILKPVVSESGTDVPIERVDDRDGRDDRSDRDDDDDSDRAIEAAFAGNVTAGENVTVRVTENGSALANATVAVGNGPTGTTDADGEYVVSVPSDAEELEIEVESGDTEAELEAEFEGEGNGSGDGGPDDGNPGKGSGNGQGN